MLLDCTAYSGPCACGREHKLVTEKVIVEYGAIKDFDRYMAECGLTGRRTVIYDSNTYKLPGLPHIAATKEIVMQAEGLHSEKGMIEAIFPRLDDPDVLVAVGSGTIMDFARYSAFQLGLPFAAIPTLASADGYTANICSVMIDGQKKSIPMNAPVLVVADLNIISAAPRFLTISGVADILSKYVSLADWRIAHLVSGEYYCPRVAAMAEKALEEPDFEAMTMAHMISGLTMQMLSNSRAASGAEHLIAHLVEMKPPRFEGARGVHGECVGVGTILCAEEYHAMAAKKPRAKPFVPLNPAWVREKFGPLADGILKENEHDVLALFDSRNIVDCWAQLVDIIYTIPPAEELTALFEAIGAKRTLADIGIDPALKPEVLEISAAIRNRLTFARMRRVLDFED